jgi:hypothetical protein
MASTNLDQDKQRFAEWRSQRQGRQLIPDELWQVACNHISTLGITRVAREFRLSDSKLRKKAIEAGIVLPRLEKRKITRPRKTAFQEISLDRMFVPSMAAPSLVLERPDGMRVRIEGQLPDAEYVSKLAACFLK